MLFKLYHPHKGFQWEYMASVEHPDPPRLLYGRKLAERNILPRTAETVFRVDACSIQTTRFIDVPTRYSTAEYSLQGVEMQLRRHSVTRSQGSSCRSWRADQRSSGFHVTMFRMKLRNWAFFSPSNFCSDSSKLS